ncbi:hypothetical protein ACWEO4_18615 [Streptomyces sp. NPDC004393]
MPRLVGIHGELGGEFEGESALRGVRLAGFGEQALQRGVGALDLDPWPDRWVGVAGRAALKLSQQVGGAHPR